MSSNATFDAIAPQFAADPRADTFLTLAAQTVDPGVFGNLFEQYVCALAAHMMTKMPSDLNALNAVSAGPITRRQGGDLEVSFGTVNVRYAVADADLASTAYGQMCLRIRESRAARAPFSTDIRCGAPAGWPAGIPWLGGIVT